MPQISDKAIVERIQFLKGSGDTAGLSNLLRELNGVLALPWDAYKLLLSEVEANEQRLLHLVPKELKEIAEGEGVQFSAHPPFYRVGCAKLMRNEKKAVQWEISALDNIVVETVRASSAREVMERVLTRIKEIEDVLKRAPALAKELKTTYLLLQEVGVGTERIAPNLLMVLMATKGIRKALSNGEAAQAPQMISRAAFGYLLAKLSKEPSNGLQIELKPATQLETSTPHTFLSVPASSLNPREIDESRLVAAIKVLT